MKRFFSTPLTQTFVWKMLSGDRRAFTVRALKSAHISQPTRARV